tara:strand:- start:15591 stop:16514 length:924 start_codon:yes stop_codon:yes gene_type:complete
VDNKLKFRNKKGATELWRRLIIWGSLFFFLIVFWFLFFDNEGLLNDAARRLVGLEDALPDKEKELIKEGEPAAMELSDNFLELLETHKDDTNCFFRLSLDFASLAENQIELKKSGNEIEVNTILAGETEDGTRRPTPVETTVGEVDGGLCVVNALSFYGCFLDPDLESAARGVGKTIEEFIEACTSASSFSKELSSLQISVDEDLLQKILEGSRIVPKERIVNLDSDKTSQGLSIYNNIIYTYAYKDRNKNTCFIPLRGGDDVKGPEDCAPKMSSGDYDKREGVHNFCVDQVLKSRIQDPLFPINSC